ncbi:MAG: FHA domain-containing protein [Rhodobacterales bacterium]|nr:FHA domain-containing protein [Rhodobacterales bacterium]
MNDADTLKLLAKLGIDDLSYQVLPLLPLIQVAWADGEIQPAERALILSVAKEKFGAGAEAMRAIKNWLHSAPNPTTLRRGRLALQALAKGSGDMALGEEVIGNVLDLAVDVAQAAGGLWGFRAITNDERAVLDDLATALKIPKKTKLTDLHGRIAVEAKAEQDRRRVTIRFNTETLDLGRLSGVLIPESMPDTKLPITAEGLVVGSGNAADVHIADHRVAEKHCTIREHNHRYYVEDHQTQLGTLVEEEAILERRLLGGENIQVGDVNFFFKFLRRVPNQML